MKQDGLLTQTTFFKYAFLNALRDEVGLTLTFRKVTLLHFLCLAIPAAGGGVGSAWGSNTHDLSRKIIGGLIGIVIGIAISWPLPKLFWNMLCLFVRKGWFLQPGPSKDVPVISCEEFIARSKTFERGELGRNLAWAIIVIATIYGASLVGDYVEKTKPRAAIGILVNIALGGFIIAALFSWLLVGTIFWKKHGLLCPACGRKITDASGGIQVPYMGLCRHCGTKIIEIKNQKLLSDS